MQPRPDFGHLSHDDLAALGDLDVAISELDRVFERLSDPAFAALPKTYRRLAGVVLQLYAERLQTLS
jgi:hypothetical protein